ncbi:MAG: efflux RND transporter periplasmic adaptor subunit [Lachnospiraceae bacterium]
MTQNEVYPETDATYAAQLQAASVGVDSAKMQLDFYTVKAPISGVVEAANVKKEDMAAAGNPAYIISNKDSMTVTFNVTEKAKNTMNVGDHVTVERNGETFDGTITEIGTMAGQQTKLFQVKATIPGAGDKLPNGVSVKVSATTEKEDGSTLVPFDALYFSGGDAYVYCVVDNKLVRTSVTVGLMDDDHAIIEDGLDADSLVVSNWSSKLRNGADAEIVSLNGESVASPEQEEDAGRRGYRGYTRRCSG